MKIVFLHGLEGKPNGSKPTHLAESGYDVIAPELDTTMLQAFLVQDTNPHGLPDEVFAKALRSARAAIMKHDPDIVVGSSFGGGLAAYLSREGLYRGPMVLLAPAAAKLFGIDYLNHPSKVAVIHGRDDNVVLPLDSIGLVTGSSGAVSLMLVDDNHRLKEKGLGALVPAVEWALLVNSD